MADEPRIPPIPSEEWDAKAPALNAEGPLGVGRLGDNNIFATLARHPDLVRVWGPFGSYLLGGTLPARDRELAILRTGFNCGSAYEWGQHVRIGLAVGLTREEIDRIPDGPSAEGWTDGDAMLLRACDELHTDNVISDATWEALESAYSTEQMIELPMLIGHYHMVAFTLRSLGVQLDQGLEDLPAG